MLASIVIRTLNEAQHLEDLLCAIESQQTDGLEWEVLLVDSGSTDGTLEIARGHGCRVLHIRREEFSFGRSLNIGCEASRGEILVLISGHCVPTDDRWLESLCRPVIDRRVAYAYGRQVGDDDSHYSERRIFAKYFPRNSRVPQDGFFCNNANAALDRTVWQELRFNEELTGLEDMELAKRVVDSGRLIGYVAEACVYHHHHESWRGVRRRFEREAIALREIMPEMQLSAVDLLRYVVSSIWMDWRSAWKHGHLGSSWRDIVQYRAVQYFGSYVGSHDRRKLTQEQKDIYFYPLSPKIDEHDEWLKSNRRVAPNEGKQ